MKLMFWFSIITILYTYAVYPVIVYILSIFCKKPVKRTYPYPLVSILMAVHNEEKNIERKMESLLVLDYPGSRIEILIGSDGSTDDTEKIIAGYRGRGSGDRIQDTGFRVQGTGDGIKDEEQKAQSENRPVIRLFRQEKRKGKPSILNMLVKEAKGEILIFTDARQRLDKSSVDELVKNFADRKVGSVSAELHFEGEGLKTGSGMGLYWKYEKFIRKYESRIGSMMGATGALYAIRKELFIELPKDLILDDVYIPMNIVQKGYRAIFDKKAKIYDRYSANPQEEFLRKTRTLAGNFQLFTNMNWILNPFKSPIAWQFISHKLLRLAVPFLLVAILVCNISIVYSEQRTADSVERIAYSMQSVVGSPKSVENIESVVRSPKSVEKLETKGARPKTIDYEIQNNIYTIFLVLQVIFYGCAVLGVMVKHKNRIFDIPHMFCVMNAAAVVGLYRFLTRKQGVMWERTG